MPDLQVRLTEFSDLIKGYTADFVGREWLVKEIDGLLNDPGCRFVILTGGAGVGKSALMAHLAASHPQWPRYFIRRDSRELMSPGDAKTFLLTIGGQLATLYPDLFKPDRLEVVVRQRIGDLEAGGEAVAVRIKELQTSPFYRVAIRAEQEIRIAAGKATGVEIGRLVAEPRERSMQDLQCLGLLDPAQLLYQTDPEARIVVLVDALDELRYSPAEEDILSALCEMPDMPPNLRFVVTSRREKFLDRLLGLNDARELPLAARGKENRQDLRNYAEANLPNGRLEPALARENRTRADLLQDLLDKGDGNFLYLLSVLRAIEEGLAVPAKMYQAHYLVGEERLPDDLDALYDYFLASIVEWVKKSGFGDAAWRQYLRPMLGTLAVAREPLSEEQLGAYTGLPSEDLGDLLRELRQFVEPVDDQRLYRIYHTSFAEYLLDARTNADYRIDGRKWHGRITDSYVNAWGGLEDSLPRLQEARWRDLHAGYGLRHLAAHLEGAMRATDLHLLLRLEWPAHPGGKNAWHAAKESTGDTIGYLADLNRAWQQAEYTLACHHQTASVGLQYRYALIVASLRTLASNLPGPLLVALVNDGLWTSSQALAYARRQSDPLRRAYSLQRLSRYLPESNRRQVLREALAALAENTVGTLRRSTLADLAADLPHQLLDEAVAVARATENDASRAHALAGLIPYLSELEREQVLAETLALARTVDDEGARSYALARLAPHLPKPERDKVLEAALGFAEAMTHHPFAANRVVRTIQDLAPFLPTRLQVQALAMGEQRLEEWPRAGFLSALVPHLPERLLLEALTLVQGMTNETAQARALAGLAAHLPQQSLPQVMALAGNMARPAARSRTLTALASRLPVPQRNPLLEEALGLVREIESGRDRADALVSLAAQFPEPRRRSILEEALASVWAIGDEEQQARVLAALVPHLPESERDQASVTILATAQELGDEWHRAQAMAALAPYLPREISDETLTLIQKQPAASRALILTALASPLPQPELYPMLQEALTAARGISHLRSRIVDLTQLVPHLPESEREPIAREALDAVKTLEDEAERAQSLWKVAPVLTEGQLAEALALCREIDQEWPRVNGIEALAPHLPEGLLHVALALARGMRQTSARVYTLATLAPYLPEPQRGQMLDETLEAAQEMESGWGRATALAKLVQHLPETKREQIGQEALEAAQELESGWGRATALAELVQHLREPKREQIGQEALAQARAEEIASNRFGVLGEIAPYLPERLRAESLGSALGAMRESGFYDGSHPFMSRLAKLVPPLASLPNSSLNQIWLEKHKGAGILRFLARRGRPKLLVDLHALLPLFDSFGSEAAAETFRAIQDVGRWWP